MIDIIIVNFFSSRMAVAAANSVRSQVQRIDSTTWIVDNSCDPEEEKYLRKKLPKGCEVINFGRNIGFGAACNAIYNRTRSPWVLLINPDALLLPNTLETLLQELKINTRAGAVSPVVFWDETQRFRIPPNLPPRPWREYILSRFHERSILVWLDSLMWRRRSLDLWNSRAPREQKTLSGGHVLLRREAVEEAGGLFDPDFFLYFEDTDLFLRLIQKRWKLYVVPSATAVHRYNRCGKDESHFHDKAKYMHQSYSIFWEKHFPKHWAQLALRYAKYHALGKPMVKIRDLGTLSRPPVFPVPPHLRSGWLLEWSPNVTMVPSIGGFGRGAVADLLERTSNIMQPGAYYARLSDPKKFWIRPEIIRWELLPS